MEEEELFEEPEEPFVYQEAQPAPPMPPPRTWPPPPSQQKRERSIDRAEKTRPVRRQQEDPQSYFATPYLAHMMYVHTTQGAEAVRRITRGPVSVKEMDSVDVFTGVSAFDELVYTYLNTVRVVPVEGAQASQVFRAFTRESYEGESEEGTLCVLSYVPSKDLITYLCASPREFFELTSWVNVIDHDLDPIDEKDDDRPLREIMRERQKKMSEKPLPQRAVVDIRDPTSYCGQSVLWYYTEQFRYWAREAFGTELLESERGMHDMVRSHGFHGLEAALLDALLGTSRSSKSGHWRKVCMYLIYLRFTPIQIPDAELKKIKAAEPDVALSMLRQYDPMPDTMLSLIRRHPDYLRSCGWWALVGEYMTRVRRYYSRLASHVGYKEMNIGRQKILEDLISEVEKLGPLPDGSLLYDAMSVFRDEKMKKEAVDRLRVIGRKLKENNEAAEEKYRADQAMREEAEMKAHEEAAAKDLQYRQDMAEASRRERLMVQDRYNQNRVQEPAIDRGPVVATKVKEEPKKKQPGGRVFGPSITKDEPPPRKDEDDDEEQGGYYTKGGGWVA